MRVLSDVQMQLSRTSMVTMFSQTLRHNSKTMRQINKRNVFASLSALDQCVPNQTFRAHNILLS